RRTARDVHGNGDRSRHLAQDLALGSARLAGRLPGTRRRPAPRHGASHGYAARARAGAFTTGGLMSALPPRYVVVVALTLAPGLLAAQDGLITAPVPVIEARLRG